MSYIYHRNRLLLKINITLYYEDCNWTMYIYINIFKIVKEKKKKIINLIIIIIIIIIIKIIIIIIIKISVLKVIC